MTLRERLAAGAKHQEGSRIVALRVWANQPVLTAKKTGGAA